MKLDEKGKLKSRSALARNGSDDRRSDTFDYAPYVVLAVAIVILIFSGTLTVLHFRSSLRTPGTVISEWFEDLEGEAKALLDRVSVGDFFTRDSRRKAKAHLRTGYQLYSKNRADEALEEFEEAVRADPQNPEAYYFRGRALIRLKRDDRALDDFQRAVGLKPDYREAHDNLAWLYERKRNYDQALFHLNKSIQMSRDNAWAYYHRALVQFAKGEPTKAMEDAAKACELKNQDGCRLYEEYKKRQARPEGT